MTSKRTTGETEINTKTGKNRLSDRKYCDFKQDDELKQLYGTFHFGFILVVPVDKGGSVSSNVTLHVPAVSLLAARRLLLWERASGSSRDGPSVSS